MVLTVELGGVAGKTPITPIDKLRVLKGVEPRTCLVTFQGGDRSYFAGKVQAIGSSKLPEDGFDAVALEAGNGQELKVVGVVKPRICKLCKKSLVAVGFARKNGKFHKEWAKRSYHKACWKLL